eukprot:sb/3474293/
MIRMDVPLINPHADTQLWVRGVRCYGGYNKWEGLLGLGTVSLAFLSFPILCFLTRFPFQALCIIVLTNRETIDIRNRPNQEKLVPDWLITSHATQITNSDWFFTCFSRFLIDNIYDINSRKRIDYWWFPTCEPWCSGIS